MFKDPTIYKEKVIFRYLLTLPAENFPFYCIIPCCFNSKILSTFYCCITYVQNHPCFDFFLADVKEFSCLKIVIETNENYN